MDDLMNITLDYCPHAREVHTRETSLYKVLEWIARGAFAEQVAEVRRLTALMALAPADSEAWRSWRDQQSEAKARLPGVIFPARMKRRGREYATVLTGIGCIDIDHVSPGDLPEVRQKMLKHPRCIGAFLSPSGTGIKGIVYLFNPVTIPAGEEALYCQFHRARHLAVAAEIEKITGLGVDAAASDAARLCYISHDPEFQSFQYPRCDIEAGEAAFAAWQQERLASRGTQKMAQVGPNAKGLMAVPIPEATQERVVVEVARDLGVVLLEGQSSTQGSYLCVCPGANLHSTPTRDNHSILYTTGAPTIHCYHSSCKSARDSLNKKLRSQSAKRVYKLKAVEAAATEKKHGAVSREIDLDHPKDTPLSSPWDDYDHTTGVPWDEGEADVVVGVDLATPDSDTTVSTLFEGPPSEKAMVHSPVADAEFVDELPAPISLDSSPHEEGQQDTHPPPSTTPEVVWVDESDSFMWKVGKRWNPVTMTSLERMLRKEGLSFSASPKSTISDGALYIQTSYVEGNKVDCVRLLPGLAAGIYNTDGKRILCPDGPQWPVLSAGDWSVLQGFLTELLGMPGYFYFISWLSLRLRQVYEPGTTWRPGHVLFLCGPAGTAKSYLQDVIITRVLGGRHPGSPWRYIDQQTQFNSDLFKAEHLTVHDKVPTASMDLLVSTLKDMAFTRMQSCHPKGVEPYVVPARWAISVSCNDTIAATKVIPAITPDIADKIIALSCYHSVFSQADWRIHDKMKGEFERVIPFFTHYLLNEVTIPEAQQNPRTGLKAYICPEIQGRGQRDSGVVDLVQGLREMLYPEDEAHVETPRTAKQIWDKCKSGLEAYNIRTVVWLGRKLAEISEVYPVLVERTLDPSNNTYLYLIRGPVRNPTNDAWVGT